MTHLFEDWPRLSEGLLRARRLLLMLDFDGTLSPIVEQPDDATLPAQTKLRLEALAGADVTIALVSGRSVEDVRRRVGLDGVFYVGNHGRELLRPGESQATPDSVTRTTMAGICKRLVEEFSDIPNVYVENKGLTAALHYRRVSPARRGQVKSRTREIARRLGGVVDVSEGKQVFDIVPADGESKGKAVVRLLEEQGGIPAVFPIYCGDDTTDETAFEALPPGALTVHVGHGEKPSAARYRVDDPGQISEFLERLEALLQGPKEPPTRGAL